MIRGVFKAIKISQLLCELVGYLYERESTNPIISM